MTSVIAHRGASRAAPQNTVAAFERAVEMGVDGIELDVRRSIDDHLVVHHDAVLPDGRILHRTPADELPAFVPRLGEALEACRGVMVNIEIKNDPAEPDFDPSEWLAHRLAAELVAQGDDGRWLVSSFRWPTIDRFRRLVPSIRTAWITHGFGRDLIAAAAQDRLAAIHPNVDAVDRSGVADAHRCGLAVNVWTCNERDRLAELMAWGVDGICTDVPDLALAIRG